MEPLPLLALVGAAGYALSCIVWPYTTCGLCNGTRKLRSPSGKAWRPCNRCRGEGRVVRFGRRIYERLRGY